MCYELYEQKARVPRNLSCGHTYCEYCLNQILQLKNRLECPTCRNRNEPHNIISQLSKNYIALELADKQRVLLKKLEMCSTHDEPLQFYCQDDNLQLCATCIESHSGHKFFKQNHSLPILKEKISQVQNRIKEKLDTLEKSKSPFESIKLAMKTRK